MSSILQFLLNFCTFLYETGRFRFVDSAVGPGLSGDAMLVLESRILRLRFIRDRGQLFLDMHGLLSKRGDDWYSVDVVQRMLTGKQAISAELGEQYASFLNAHLDDIEALFAAERLEETTGTLRKLEHLRAQERLS